MLDNYFFYYLAACNFETSYVNTVVRNVSMFFSSAHTS